MVRTGVLLFFLIFLMGCLNEAEMESARFECVSLSVPSFAFIPNCFSISDCWEKWNAEMGVESASFESFFVQEQWNEFKNRVAESWWYWSEARKTWEEIRAVCWNHSPPYQLNAKTNELQHWLVKAFESLDRVNAQSILLLAYQKAWLEKQQLEQTKEEALFSDWVALQANWNQLQEQTTEPPNTWAGILIGVNNKTSGWMEEKGLQLEWIRAQRVEEQAWLESESILPLLKQIDESVVRVGSGVRALSGEWLLQQRIADSLRVLRSAPAFSFFSIAQDVIGTQDSVTSVTTALAFQWLAHEEQMRTEWQALKMEIQNRLEGAHFQITEDETSELNTEEEQFFSQLRAGNRALFTEGLDGNGSVLGLEEKWQSLREKAVLLESKEALAEAWGLRLLHAKQLLQQLETLEEGIEKRQDRIRAWVRGVCQEPLANWAKKTTEGSGTGAALHREAIFLAQQFIQAENEGDKWKWCKKGLLQIGSWEAWMESPEQFLFAQDRDQQYCRETVNRLFESQSTRGSGLVETWFLLEQRVPENELEQVEWNRQCRQLLQKAQGQWLQSPTVEEISRLYDHAQRWHRAIERSGVSDSISNTVETEWRLIQTWFEGAQLKIEKGGMEKEVLEEVQAIEGRLREAFQQALQKSLENSLQLQLIAGSHSASTAGYAVDVQGIFHNMTGEAWPLELGVDIPFEGVVQAVSEKPDWITSLVKTRQGLRINWSSVPTGVTVIRWRAQVEISTTEEDQVVSLVPARAWIQRRIVAHSPIDVEKIEVKTTLPLEAREVLAVEKNRELSVHREGNVAVFFVSLLLKDGEASIFFALDQPLRVIEQMEKQEHRIEWRVLVENRTAFVFEKIPFHWAVPTQGLVGLQVMDEAGKKVAWTRSEEELSWSIDRLGPRQKKAFVISVTTNGSNAWWNAIISSGYELLNDHWMTADSVERAEAGLIRSELDRLQTAPLIDGAAVAFAIKRAREWATKIEAKEAKEKGLGLLKKQIQEKMQAWETIGNRLSHGPIKNVREIENALNRIQQDWQKQSVLQDEKELLRILAGLEDIKSILGKGVEDEEKDLQELQEKLFEQIRSVDLQDVLVSGVQEVEKRSVARSAFWETPEEILASTEAWKNSLEALQQKANAHMQRQGEGIEEQLGLLQKELVGGALEKRNRELEDWLKEVSEEERNQARLFLPFSEAEVKKRGQRIAQLLSIGEQNALTAILDKIHEGSFAEAVQLFVPLEASFEKTTRSMKQLESEIQTDREWVIDRARQSVKNWTEEKQDRKTAALLAEAEQALDENRFLKAWWLTKQARPTDSAESGYATLFSAIPRVLWPLLVAVIALVGYRWREKNKKEPVIVKAKIERIPSEW